MKKILLLVCLFCIAFFGFSKPEPPPTDDFCTQLKKMLEAAKEGFAPIKGEATTRMITGHEKKFYLATMKFVDEHECYINHITSYPECECILETDTCITEKLSGAYETYKKQIENCFDRSGHRDNIKKVFKSSYLERKMEFSY